MMISHNRRKEDLPPASLEAQRRREFKCGVYFAHAGTHGQNKRHILFLPSDPRCVSVSQAKRVVNLLLNLDTQGIVGG